MMMYLSSLSRSHNANRINRIIGANGSGTEPFNPVPWALASAILLVGSAFAYIIVKNGNAEVKVKKGDTEASLKVGKKPDES